MISLDFQTEPTQSVLNRRKRDNADSLFLQIYKRIDDMDKQTLRHYRLEISDRRKPLNQKVRHLDEPDGMPVYRTGIAASVQMWVLNIRINLHMDRRVPKILFFPIAII